MEVPKETPPERAAMIPFPVYRDPMRVMTDVVTILFGLAATILVVSRIIRENRGTE